MTPQEVLARVLEAGGRVIPDPERPRLLVPPALKPLVAEHRKALRALLLSEPPAPRASSSGSSRSSSSSSPLEPALVRRVKAFWAQLALWTGPGMIPLLVLPGAPEPQRGRCVSCGDPAPDGWRCGLCLRAVYIALGMPRLIEPGEAP